MFFQSTEKPLCWTFKFKDINQPITSLSVVSDEDDESEEEDQTILKPKAISEEKTRLRPTGTRRIGFKGDENGASMPTNLPYSPRKLTWKGKRATTSNQLTIEKKKLSN